MRAPTVDEIFEYPEHAEFHTKANIGYDFILISKALDEAPFNKFVQVFPTLARNPLGVIVASCAIEGYIHYVGHHIDRDWSEFTKWPKSVRTRIERIYSLLKKPVDFDSGFLVRSHERRLALLRLRSTGKRDASQAVGPEFQA